jgi:DNA-binding transcriptional LysR family regulator
MPNINDVYARDLDLNLLRVFAAVAEEGGITRAASRLYVTQPAVSAAMRRLTEFVGTELVTRQGRGIVLTSRGVELLAAARTHLRPLVAATMAVPLFDPKVSTATTRVGLGDAMETVLLPALLTSLRAEATQMNLVVLPVQFRTVEELLLTNKVDFAVTVADELPRSILRQPLISRADVSCGFVCLYDPRFAKLPKKLSEREYFAHEHVAVSCAGDARGIVEDSVGKSRAVRVAVPAFSYVVEVVDGSPLLATVPALLARHIVKTRPYLRIAPLPFSLDGSALELLWSRVSDDDAAGRDARGVMTKVVGVVMGKNNRRAVT